MNFGCRRMASSWARSFTAAEADRSDRVWVAIDRSKFRFSLGETRLRCWSRS